MEYSRGLWLIPSYSPRTKTIAVGQSAAVALDVGVRRVETYIGGAVEAGAGQLAAEAAVAIGQGVSPACSLHAMT
ncbi:hypothetical protein [Streptomyces sp. 5-10]|uniref:hypothetical protein n=1 Tax=Streptomyces sp. 5-10 TaxID=878925 RepID=UPI00168ABCD5|nr:hypothetical protein [Streptomyces sp. 5-10]MBD3002773.1 hypothetical protein [Streptomyces sp. 5-10]